MFNEVSAARNPGTVVRIAVLQNNDVIRYDLVSDSGDDTVANLITSFERIAKDALNTLPNTIPKWAVFGYMRVFKSPLHNEWTSEVWLDLTDKPKFFTKNEHDALLASIPHNAVLFDTYKEGDIKQ